MMMPQPMFAPQMAAESFPPGPPFMGQPMMGQQPMMAQQPGWPGPGPAQPQGMPGGLMAQQRGGLPAPVIRAQADDEPETPDGSALADQPAPAALSIPSPEDLGVGDRRPAADRGDDWAALHGRLGRLGATCLHVEKLPDGGSRFVCLLPTDRPTRSHRVEVRAATEREAMRLAVEKAEEWAGGGK